MSQEVSHRTHSGVPCSIARQTMSDSWLSNWHWHRFAPQYFGFTLAVSFQRWSILIFVYICVNQKDKLLRTGNLPKSGDHWIEGNFLRLYLVNESSVSSLYTINPTKKSCCNISEFDLQAVHDWRLFVAATAMLPLFLKYMLTSYIRIWRHRNVVSNVDMLRVWLTF